MIDVEDPPDALIWKGSTTESNAHYDEQDKGTGSAQCIVTMGPRDRPRLN
jgi:hypothetical protein